MTNKTPIRLAPVPPPTNPKRPPQRLGAIRMSPLQYGSLNYIASRHRSGSLDIDELSNLKQTQIRSFITHKWIEQTGDRTGIVITEQGKRDLRAFTSNDQFFRQAATLSFTSLLNLRIPGMEDYHKARRPKPVERTLTVWQSQEKTRGARAS